jgi:hypothetical protein
MMYRDIVLFNLLIQRKSWMNFGMCSTAKKLILLTFWTDQCTNLLINQSNSMSCPYQSTVRSHAGWFAEDGNVLTKENIVLMHKKQNITRGVDIKARAISNMASDRLIPFDADSLTQFTNPSKTGLWNANGSFNRDVFNMLARRAIDMDGKRIVTREHFDELLKEVHGADYFERDFGNATHIFYVVPVSWRAVTKGSIDELFLYYSDAKDERGQNALTVQRVEEFYTNPNAVMQQRIDSLKR